MRHGEQGRAGARGHPGLGVDPLDVPVVFGAMDSARAICLIDRPRATRPSVWTSRGVRPHGAAGRRRAARWPAAASTASTAAPSSRPCSACADLRGRPGGGQRGPVRPRLRHRVVRVGGRQQPGREQFCSRQEAPVTFLRAAKSAWPGLRVSPTPAAMPWTRTSRSSSAPHPQPMSSTPGPRSCSRNHQRESDPVRRAAGLGRTLPRPEPCAGLSQSAGPACGARRVTPGGATGQDPPQPAGPRPRSAPAMARDWRAGVVRSRRTPRRPRPSA